MSPTILQIFLLFWPKNSAAGGKSHDLFSNGGIFIVFCNELLVTNEFGTVPVTQREHHYYISRKLYNGNEVTDTAFLCLCKSSDVSPVTNTIQFC